MLDPPKQGMSENPINFVHSPKHTLGVELEVSLVDRESRQLIPRAPALLDQIYQTPEYETWCKPELFQTIVETVTGICRDVSDVRRDLEARLQVLSEHATPENIGLLCVGTHPTSDWSQLPITNDPRYHRLVENMQWPARRLLICGVHVHVGVPSGEHAIAVMNSLTCFIPHIIGISASSPYWLGVDTGLASSRIKVFEALPTAGLPPKITNWAEFVTLMRTLLGAGSVQSIREIWWDIRPHPGFGTVELRMADGVNTLSEVTAIAAFAQCLVAWLCEHYDHGEPLPFLKNWTLAENKWRAARYGEKAMLIRNERGDTIPIDEHIREWLDYLAPKAKELGCSEELRYVHHMLDIGPSYRRQRAMFEATGSFEGVVDCLMEELKNDTPWVK